ncbi:unnamed protein product [Gongylonema pulchrum]|uniref:Uncharacterized protein n=1 Tax=Gongylonema pulchrum TaxID=637853 RepID=A0A183CX73_9BILA|nr:unnamed protein product [Gongylonema pulchrum]
MSGSDRMRQGLPPPTQFFQEEEPSDEDEQDEEYNQPLALFRRSRQPTSSAAVGQAQAGGRAPIPTSSFYGTQHQPTVNFGNCNWN